MTSDKLNELVAMSNDLAREERRCVIIGEGNTSIRIDNETFYVKASGRSLHGITADGFVAVRFDPILHLLDVEGDSTALQDAMNAARVDPQATLRPSVEVTFHALLLHECGVQVIAHSHPVVVNQILCSPRAADFAYRRMFPDEIVLCGPRSLLVPYVDPGVPLARILRDEVRQFMDLEGEPPKVILLHNHGLIALAQTPTEALNITAMAVKAAEIFMGAALLGGPVFLTDADVQHIYQRPDEIYRRGLFARTGT